MVKMPVRGSQVHYAIPTITPDKMLLEYDVLKLVPEGGNWKNLPDEIQRSYMKKNYYNTGGRTGIARRMSWNEPCLTLLCSPSSLQTERCHPSETRPFTIREYARIQTFPDSYHFVGSIASQYKQIGNAVPVNLAYHIGLSLYKSLQEYYEYQKTP
jgi:DNA (cytosine-5)-methyltransferase 1